MGSVISWTPGEIRIAFLLAFISGASRLDFKLTHYPGFPGREAATTEVCSAASFAASTTSSKV